MKRTLFARPIPPPPFHATHSPFPREHYLATPNLSQCGRAISAAKVILTEPSLGEQDKAWER